MPPFFFRGLNQRYVLPADRKIYHRERCGGKIKNKAEGDRNERGPDFRNDTYAVSPRKKWKFGGGKWVPPHYFCFHFGRDENFSNSFFKVSLQRKILVIE